MFIYPKELYTRLKELWRSQRLASDERKIPHLPPDPLLKRLIEVAYHASFMSEESRKIVFHLVYLSPQGLAEPGEAKSSAIVFKKSRPFNESELLRLAPATDPTKVLIGIYTEGDGEEEDESLRIWGLLDTGSSWWDFIHGEAASGFPPPNQLTISSAEPGNLVISRAGQIILKLQQGEIFSPTGGILKRGPIADFFDSAVTDLYNEVCQALKCRRYADKEHDDYPHRLYLQYFERIIFHIRRKMHGGMVIVVPDHLSVDDPQLRERLLVKYPCTDDRAWHLLVTSLVESRQYMDQHEAVMAGDCTICPSTYAELASLHRQLDHLSEALTDSLKFVAALSGVDGAVLVTDRLKLIGFGAEVVVTSPQLEHVKVSHDVQGNSGRLLSIESFGTRHRSAFRFCSSMEDAVTFVISQDGGVKAIKGRKGETVCWSDINLGLFGI
jgi:hypothetical protein